MNKQNSVIYVEKFFVVLLLVKDVRIVFGLVERLEITTIFYMKGILRKAKEITEVQHITSVIFLIVKTDLSFLF